MRQMPADDALTRRVRAALSHLPDVEEKKMFGARTFMVNGKMCVSVRAERIMCRIDPAIHDAMVEMEGCSAMEMKGRAYPGYVHGSHAVLNTKKQLDFWLGLA